jgi:hypothetical protein
VKLPAALAAVLLIGALSCGGTGEPEPEPGPAPVGTSTEAVPAKGEESEVIPLRRGAVEIYFPSALGNGLVGEFREIFDTVTPGDRAKQIIADLISGPATPDALRAVPAGTRLRQVYVLDNGVAYLDFSSELSEGLGGGSMRELLTVYSIVDSVALGVREISRVAILVNGQPLETLNGHMDLRRPLPPDFSLILGSIVT